MFAVSYFRLTVTEKDAENAGWKRCGSPGTEVPDICELPCGCWQQSPGPLPKPSMLLTAKLLSGPSFGPLNIVETVKTMETSEVMLNSFCSVRWAQTSRGKNRMLMVCM